MSEMSFEQLLEESLVTIHNGEVVKGTVIGVKEDEIILNIGYKADGIITRSEYTNAPNVDLTTMVQVGTEMEAKVLKVNELLGDGYEGTIETSDYFKQTLKNYEENKIIEKFEKLYFISNLILKQKTIAFIILKRAFIDNLKSLTN